jgi:hypothetical protein
VIVHVRGGGRFEHLQPTRKGDPDLPLTDAELDDKYRELAVPVIGSERAASLLETLWALEEVESARSIDPGTSRSHAATAGAA